MQAFSPCAAALAIAAAALSVPASAQQLNAGDCILAGRLNASGKWAPRFEDVRLLAASGREITSPTREQLGDVRRVRIVKPALLARCDGDGELARSDDEAPVAKEPVPAVSPGFAEVEAVAFPKLRRGGELVEVRLKVPLDRVVMVKR